MRIEKAIDIIEDIVMDYGDRVEKELWEDIKLTAEFEEIYEKQLNLIAFSSVFDKYTADTGKHKKADKAWKSLINVIVED